MPDVFHRKRLEIVFFEEIIGAKAKKLKGNTNMAAEVKPVQHMHTRAAKKKYIMRNPDFKLHMMILMVLPYGYLLFFISIKRLELIKHLNLRHSSLSVTINIFNDLQSNSSSAGKYTNIFCH